MQFHLLQPKQQTPAKGENEGYLTIDRWNDFSYVTQFYLQVFDKNGVLHQIGNVKIGFVGQTTDTDTYSLLDTTFSNLNPKFFSLAEDKSYYEELKNLDAELRENILSALNDLVRDQGRIPTIESEGVFNTSLLRGNSLYYIREQCRRILDDLPELSNYAFEIFRPESAKLGEVAVQFSVKKNSKPSSNIHAVIGRNGSGKTKLLNSIVESITTPKTSDTQIFDTTDNERKKISKDYFNSLVSVSYSAFDPFIPPNDQPEPAKGTCYYYIGLKQRPDDKSEPIIVDSLPNKDSDSLRNECLDSLYWCFTNVELSNRWSRALELLSSDDNLSEMRLDRLYGSYCEIRDLPQDERKSIYKKLNEPLLKRLSSGHLIVLLTTTRLVHRIGEKTLVLLDEPESYLHPPLLSAFIRAIEQLLHEQNAVAIIATHSPVVLQEIPTKCVWKINRAGKVTKFKRPRSETFGESVSTLTHEVFGLETSKSGFYKLLKDDVDSGKSYEEILDEYREFSDYPQLGMEAKSLLVSMVATRDKRNDQNS